MSWAYIENSEYSASEEAFNVVTHGAGLLLGVLGGAAALQQAQTPTQWWSVLVYSTTLCLLFLASTLYHAVHHSHLKPWLQKLDHASIYLFIAGSYTPFLFVSLQDSAWKWPLFAMVWGMALLGVVIKAISVVRFSAMSMVLYVAMGWLVVLAARDMIAALPTPALVLLALGGLSYTGGIVFFVKDQWKFNHAVWHLFVLLGVGAHFTSIYAYVLQ